MFEANPFTPGKRLTQPELFSGRRDQLKKVTRALIQTASGNARHILVTGERGVGKSSFSSQAQGIARGEDRFLELIGPELPEKRHILYVVEHIALDRQTAADVALGILHELEAAKKLQRFLRFNFDFTIDLGPLQAAAKQKTPDTTDIVTNFVDGVQKIVDHVTPATDGILIVIDEIDRIAANAGISTFLKAATEKLSSRGVENVSFLLVGLLGTLDKLKEEHPSAGRIFRPLEVPLMTEDEAIELIEKALADSSVEIEDAAARELASYSGGYANTVHILGEQAFEIASDGSDRITLDVVSEAVAAAVEDSAREDYDPRYVRFQGRTRSMVDFMATQTTPDIAFADVQAHLGVRATDLSSNFDTLLRNDVLVRPKEGVYRFREPLFREYIRYIVENDRRPVQRRPRRREAS